MTSSVTFYVVTKGCPKVEWDDNKYESHCTEVTVKYSHFLINKTRRMKRAMLEVARTYSHWGMMACATFNKDWDGPGWIMDKAILDPSL